MYTPPHFGAEFFTTKINPDKISQGLVVGCKNGEEVEYLHKSFEGAFITGFDVEIPKPVESKLVKAGAEYIPFGENTFDFVFYHHVIEHVEDPEKTIKEVSRVLKPAGVLFIGAPNKKRLLGYLGSSTASWREKIMWNFRDYKKRFFGQFKNELGAHAGFELEELRDLLEKYLRDVNEVTESYLEQKYKGTRISFILFLLKVDFFKRIFPPSVYFFASK